MKHLVYVQTAVGIQTQLWSQDQMDASAAYGASLRAVQIAERHEDLSLDLLKDLYPLEKATEVQAKKVKSDG